MSRCGSLSPDGHECTRVKGHQGRRWRHYNPKAEREWEGGVKNPSRWRREDDSYHFTEGDYQSWMRHTRS